MNKVLQLRPSGSEDKEEVGPDVLGIVGIVVGTFLVLTIGYCIYRYIRSKPQDKVSPVSPKDGVVPENLSPEQKKSDSDGAQTSGYTLCEVKPVAPGIELKQEFQSSATVRDEDMEEVHRLIKEAKVDLWDLDKQFDQQKYQAPHHVQCAKNLMKLLNTKVPHFLKDRNKDGTLFAESVELGFRYLRDYLSKAEKYYKTTKSILQLIEQET